LFSYLADLFRLESKMDIISEILEKKKSKSGPYVILFLGINGAGKTTTIAKFTHLLQEKQISVVLAAGDTHRAGAIEQLSQHAKNLGVKIIVQRYGADPSAVGRDAIEHAKKNYVDVVLIDTAGRMQTSKNLMEEIRKIVSVVKPDAKIFVGDSLSGNDTIYQAQEFFQYTNFDGTILTKSDADSKGGSAISISYLTHKPILFLGTGQGYEDLTPFDSASFIESLFGNSTEDLPNLTSQPSNGLKVSTKEYKSKNAGYELEIKNEIYKPEMAQIAEVDDDKSSEKNESSLDFQNTIDSGDKSKRRGIFGRFFSKKKEIEELGSNGMQQEIQEKVKGKEKSSDETIYLDDEDINELRD
ncbi:MAG: signal recognition particle-docking protein FtsY, partial [Nitrososphaeraceae archaeon]